VLGADSAPLDHLAGFQWSYFEGKGREEVRRRVNGFFFILKHSWALKRSCKISHGGSGKVLDFFVSKRVGTLIVFNDIASFISHENVLNYSHCACLSVLKLLLKTSQLRNNPPLVGYTVCTKHLVGKCVVILCGPMLRE